ncbi:MAG: class I lanthipeptide [Acidobacteria bacterium]|nr:class I lanthipeptide [Acidobacteriota bacterium]
MKKHPSTLKKLSLNVETLAALQQDRLDGAWGGHYSIPGYYTCPECAPQGAHRRK